MARRPPVRVFTARSLVDGSPLTSLASETDCVSTFVEILENGY